MVVKDRFHFLAEVSSLVKCRFHFVAGVASTARVWFSI